MREIKFRAWHKKLKILSSPFNPLQVNYRIEFVNTPYDSQDLDSMKHMLFMQYTGLKDKNGKEIYEGDIVKGLSGNGVVEWFNELTWDSAGSPHPGFWCKEWCEYKEPGELSYHDGFSDECEVIGNIYENKEVLN